MELDILAIINTGGVVAVLVLLIVWLVNGTVVPAKVIEQIVTTAVKETLAELDRRFEQRSAE